MPVVICHLEAGESMITEGGSMVWMSPNMEMQTSGGGSVGKALGRLFSGEKIFQNIYTITKYDGLDPEVYGGIDGEIYPRPRTYILGVKVNF